MIVGGGTAGCVLAARLSEDPATRVTLVEAGPERGARSVSYLDDLAVPGALWDGYPQGRGLGGSSAVNGGVLSGGEDDERIDGVLLPRRWLAREEVGIIDHALLEADADAEPAVITTTSTSEAYLDPARDRPNLTVLTDTVVSHVALDGCRAVGAVTADGSELAADRVVVAAGAVRTPALLLRSGVDTPGIGEGLADHPSRTLELVLRDGVGVDVHGMVTGAALRRGAIEIVALNHLGPDRPGRAALLVGLLESEWRRSVAAAVDGSPVVSMDELSSHDARELERGVLLARELLSKPAFAEVVDAFDLVSGSSAYAHACCSSAIGRVAEPDGAVRRYSGLYVGDASALPALPASGTYLPVVLQAERLARTWAGRASTEG